MCYTAIDTPAAPQAGLSGPHVGCVLNLGAQSNVVTSVPLDVDATPHAQLSNTLSLV
jgi:hypothetical protein